MTKRSRVPGRPASTLFAALILAQSQAAEARDLAAGVASCVLGPVGGGAEGGADAFAGLLFVLRSPSDAACPPFWQGPVLPSAPRPLALAAVPGPGLVPPDPAGEPQLTGLGPVGVSAVPPARPEDATPRARADGPMEPLWGVISELRLGALSHDIIFPGIRNVTTPNPFRHHFERGVNLNGEIAFVSPGFLHAIGSPRPRVGGSVNTLGYTSNAYFDLDWRYQLAVGPFFEGFLGLALHDGKLRNANPQFAELGTRFLFHIGLEAGFRLYRRHGLSLFWEHMSNSALANKNQGMDSTGLRYGYRFGD